MQNPTRCPLFWEILTNGITFEIKAYAPNAYGVSYEQRAIGMWPMWPKHLFETSSIYIGLK